MVIHTLLFEDYMHKHDAIEWLKEHVMSLEHIDEKLGEKKIVFVTGVALTKHIEHRMARENIYASYEVHDL